MSAHGTPTVRRPPGLSIAAATACVALAAFALYAAVGMPGGPELYKTWAFGATLALVAGTIALRAAHDPAERGAWSAFAASFAALLGGWVAYWLLVEGDPTPPYPSIADAFWLCGYALSYYALVLLVRARATRFDGSVLLDGAIGVLALSAVGAAVLIDQIAAATGGSASHVLLGLSYPLADVVMIGTVVTVLVVTGWPAGRSRPC
jgi:hypothetical protein